MDLPPILDFDDPVLYLNAVHDSCPPAERPALVRRLARGLEVTPAHVRNLLKGRRELTLAALPGLRSALDLSDSDADYLRRILEKHVAGHAELPAARLAVWAAHQTKHGKPLKDIGAKLGRPLREESARALLAAAVETLGEEAPPPDRMARGAIVPVSEADLSAAREIPAAIRRLGPGLTELQDPAESMDAARSWSGVFGLVGRALLHTRREERAIDVWVWSADEAAAREIDAARRRLKQRLKALAERGAHVPADRLHLITTPHLTLSETWRSSRRLWDGESCAPALQSRVEAAKNSPEMPKVAQPSPAFLYGKLSLPEILSAWRAGRPRELRSAEHLAKRVRTVNAAYINDLIYGRKRFQRPHVSLVAEMLSLSGDADAVAWLDGVARLGEPLSHAERLGVMRTLRGIAAQHGVFLPEAETASMLSSWQVSATYALSFLPMFRAAPSWVSRAVYGRMSQEEAEEALVTLRSLGLLNAEGQRTPDAPSACHLEHESLANAAFHLQHQRVLRLFEAELDMLSEAHGYSAWLLALPGALWGRLQEIMRAFNDEILAALQGSDERGAPDRVLLNAAHCVPLFALPSRGPLRR